MQPIALRPDRYTLMAAILGGLGLAWRIWLTLVESPPTNSDEATMGLAALHVSQGRGLPVFFYGQHYMGTIEAYLAAPLVGLFGPSVTALRVPTLLLYALFLVLMFLLVRRLFSAGLAVLTTALLAFGADRVVKNQLIAGGGYPETGPMVAGLLLLTYALLAADRPRRRVFAGWGLLAGLIVWNHWLPAPYLLGALILLVAGRVLTRRAAVVTAGGFLLGALPLLVDNVLAGPRHNSIAVFLSLNGAGTDPSLWDRIVGGAWLGLPMGMGLCAPSRCDGWSLWWGPVVVALLATALVLSVRALRRPAVEPEPGSAADPERARQQLRLVLAAAGLVSILTYVRSPAAADSSIESARYLSTLALSLPVALWPLWRVVRSGTGWAIPAAVPIAALVATMLAATVSLTDAVPQYRSMRTSQAGLVAALDRAGLTYVHSEYWTCNWITYLTGERITCGVVDDQLDRGFNRYPRYWRPEARAVVAPVGSALDTELAHRPGFTPQTVTGYHIYTPITPP
ncbi:glycosyltransferase family 39 protein [Micromonospora sp. NBC_01796]|uniref:glycosyltransferase family 39 protein n=1 Tax=Micromonospora sp. NBC_01796 TaxID=2975987 RepID=UPI002DDA6C1E|nr:glycosyltransferase family 39 protein [Micromonospora sp. NBC_01796]WSA83391.1 glycosyltransferase family 39 protein [Micromonospora sp. NBC_01796]